MKEYKDKKELINEIQKSSKLFIEEFDDVNEYDRNKIIDGVDRSPAQMIIYQLGWLNLLMSWDRDELEGKEVITPAPNYKWNTLGGLYDSFYKQCENYSLSELKEEYVRLVSEFIEWISTFSNAEFFGQDIRKWASSTPSKWKIWKWIHINTVAPFKSFRTKIRKWKRLNLQ